MLSAKDDSFAIEIQNKMIDDYNEFREYQKKAQRTLEFFHDVCEKNQITYYLAYGSLLGAIRDNGQIPWDYDIDVWVPYEQAEKLMVALDSNIGDEYHYTTRFKDKKCRTYTIKLAPSDMDCEVVHVDVFWLVGASDNPKELKKINKVKIVQQKASLLRYTPVRYLGINGRVATIKYRLQKLKYSIYTPAKLDRMFKYTMKYSCENSKYWTDNITFRTFDCEWFGKPSLIEFANGKMFYVPENFDKVLVKCYGDYMSIPDIQCRIDEFSNALKRLQTLGHIKSR